MKPIKLTEKQKKHLLEMCKKLFPEYTDIDIRDYNDECFPISKQDAPCIFFWTNQKYEVFHWYEFCINELLLRLYQVENDTFGISDAHTKAYIKEIGVMIFYQYKKHIIDYLYEEFKKLRKVNYGTN